MRSEIKDEKGDWNSEEVEWWNSKEGGGGVKRGWNSLGGRGGI